MIGLAGDAPALQQEFVGRFCETPPVGSQKASDTDVLQFAETYKKSLQLATEVVKHPSLPDCAGAAT